jgi:hypothetical protein
VRHKTILKTILPPVFGALAFWSFNQFWGFIYPSDPYLGHQIELSTPGIVFVIEHLLNFLGPIFLLLFQYFVIVPVTNASTKKALLVTLCVGFGLCFVICLQMLKPGVPITLKEFALAFTNGFMQFESYFLINLATITLLNNIKPKLSLNQN